MMEKKKIKGDGAALTNLKIEFIYIKNYYIFTK